MAVHCLKYGRAPVPALLVSWVSRNSLILSQNLLFVRAWLFSVLLVQLGSVARPLIEDPVSLHLIVSFRCFLVFKFKPLNSLELTKLEWTLIIIV